MFFSVNSCLSSRFISECINNAVYDFPELFIPVNIVDLDSFIFPFLIIVHNLIFIND